MSPSPPRSGTIAILLAAGASRRMGTPKPLLPWRGEPLVRHMARTLRDGGAEQVRVVVGPDSTGDAIAHLLADVPRVISLVNPAPEHGMLSSVQIGMQEAGQTLTNIQAWLVCPCDLPLLEPADVAAVLDSWNGDTRSIIAPVYGGKRGHPTLFGSFWTAEIQAMDAVQVGLNTLLARYPEAVREAALTSSGIVRDADTPLEWQALQADR